MKLAIIPQPQSLRLTRGTFRSPRRGVIGIGGESVYSVAEDARAFLPGHDIAAARPRISDTLTIKIRDGMKPGGYRLKIKASGIVLEAHSPAAAFHGMETLRQIVSQARDGKVPCLTINDWPDIPDRGVYYDLTRGRVPKLERLIEMADLLSRYKINQLQLYFEHTFQFRGHPDIGRGASPLSAEDILALDAYCRGVHVELVPSLASFGHLSSVLRHKQYHHLAEDWGVGKYVDPDKKMHSGIVGWTLSPAKAKSYDFLDSLFAEFLPLFSSKKFNICCDETYDLGWGQSRDLCRKKGKGRVYLDHIIRVNKLCRKYGKKIMFWGDIIRHYPKLIKDIPKDVTVLDWGYSARMDFDRVRDFVKTGLTSYVCPSVVGYRDLFPRIHEARGNIAGWARAAVRHGADGLLNTDWGDGGHYNFMEYSWHGYLFGAEQSWNVRADSGTFTARFCKLFLNIDTTEFARALDILGDIAHLHCDGYFQQIWQHIFFAPPGDAVLNLEKAPSSVCRNGKISGKRVTLDAKFGRETIRKLKSIRKIFVKAAKQRHSDPRGLLPYWIFAVDTMIHAARKLTVLGVNGRNTPAVRRALKTEMRRLMKRFEKLWMARNRRSEIRITLKRCKKAIRNL